MTIDSTVNFSKQLEVSDLNGEKVMIDFETGKYFCLKGSANDIWDYMSEKGNAISVKDVVAKLLSIYEVDEQTCSNSVLSFLSQLESNGFIVEA